MPANRRRWFWTLGLVAAAIGALGVAGCGRYGCRHGHDPAQRADWIAKKIASELDLNDAQKAKLDLIKQEFLAQREKGKQEREEAFQTLLAQIRSKQLDTEKLQALIDRRHKHMEEVAPTVLKKIADFHASLSDEQKEKAARKFEKFHSHWR
jgi:uncharacterized membrane protein